MTFNDLMATPSMDGEKTRATKFYVILPVASFTKL
jgi:hypothetical protein